MTRRNWEGRDNLVIIWWRMRELGCLKLTSDLDFEIKRFLERREIRYSKNSSNLWID